MAENDPTTPYVPPGNRALISVVTEYGVDRVHGWLASSGWLAIHMDVFALDPKTGREYIIDGVELWNSERAVEVLRTGKLGDLVLFVRNFDWPPDHVFMPPDEREGFPPPSPEPIKPEEEAPEESRPKRGRNRSRGRPLREVPKSKGGKPPLTIWADVIEPHFDPEVERNGPFPSLGAARDAVIGLLQARKKGLPDERTIERHINNHRPWWVRGGVRGA